MHAAGGRGPARLVPALVLLCLFACDGAETRDALAGDGAKGSRPGAGAVLPFTLRGRWPADSRRITWNLTDHPGPLEASDFRAAVTRALRVWSDSGVAGFMEASADTRADVTIGWCGSLPDGSGCPGFPAGQGVLALTGPVRPGTWMRFNAGLEWSADGSRGFGFLQAALHEIGHLLGLGESPDPDALMHPVHDRDHRGLTDAELAGLATLYGPPDPRAGDLVVQVNGRAGSFVRGIRGAPRLALVATPGDAGSGLLMWPTEGPGAGTLMGLLLDEQGRATRTVGPVPGLLPVRHPVHVVSAGSRPLVLTLLPEGRYRAHAFDETGLPVATISPGAPLVIGEAWRDQDGDGVFEHRDGPLPFLDRSWQDLAAPGARLAAAGLEIHRR